MNFNRISFVATLALTLSACGGGGGSSAPTTASPAAPVTPVTPAAPAPAATSSLKISSDFAVVGNNITLTWSSTDAATCTAGGAWSGDVGKSGTKDVTPALGSAQYTVTCGTSVSTASVETLPTSYAVTDSKLEAALVTLGADDVVDGKVDTAKALKVTSLELTASGITNLAGLEAYRNLTKLTVLNQSGLTKADTTKLTKLTFLAIQWTPITSIDLSQNSALKLLGLSQTELKTVDLSALVNVEELDLHNDVDNPEATDYQYGVTKGLTSLDVSKNVNLQRLYVGFNLLTSIDTSHNPKLTDFWGAYNRFESLDFSKGNPVLSSFVIRNTTKMTSPLKYLNIKNTSMNGTPQRLYTENNPLLKEIHVGSIVAVQNFLKSFAVGLEPYRQDSWTAFTEQ